LAHPQSAGHGINIQHGGHICVFYGLPWSLEYYQQFRARLHRSGQTKTVIIHHIIAEGTVDERVIEVLGDKEVTQDMLIDATLYREIRKPEPVPGLDFHLELSSMADELAELI
jgi:SNF2 family DNA or RNA helicase